MTTTIQISHKIKIASPSNKFKTYCRKAFGISRFALSLTIVATNELHDFNHVLGCNYEKDLHL